jgi:putative NADH-flavin reductase
MYVVLHHKKHEIMKSIALFGASGMAGKNVLYAALQGGYKVNALVRNPEEFGIIHPNLTITKGDVLNELDVDKVIVGADVVVSVFGHVKNSPEWLQTNGTKNIIKSMHKNNVERIISLSGGGLPFPEKDKPKFVDKLIRTIMKFAVPKILNDAIAHAEVLKNSDKKWVIVRGPRLTNDPKLNTYRVGWVGVNASTKISREDLADFILSQVEDETYTYQMPFVSI